MKETHHRKMQHCRFHHQCTQRNDCPVTIGFDLPTCFKVSIALDEVLHKLPEGTPGVMALGAMNRLMKEKVLLALNDRQITIFQLIRVTEPDVDPELPF